MVDRLFDYVKFVVGLVNHMSYHLACSKVNIVGVLSQLKYIVEHLFDGLFSHHDLLFIALKLVSCVIDHF